MKWLLRKLSTLLVFFSLAQPGILFPSMANYRVFFILALASCFLFACSISGGDRVRLLQNKYVIGILFTYTLSEAQYLYFSGAVEVWTFWIKKIILYFIIINLADQVVFLKKYFWATVLATCVLSFYGWDLFLYSPELLANEGRLQAVGNYNLSNSFALILAVSVSMRHLRPHTETTRDCPSRKIPSAAPCLPMP